ncbi:MAG: Crp/Fnr family transcriptional regulator [Candidatus Altimarinota bacterium]
MKRFLQTLPIFKGLKENDYSLLEKNTQLLPFSKHEVFFKKGDPVTRFFVLRQGKVKLFEDRKLTQREEIISVVSEGDCFDLSSLFHDHHRISAQALDEGEAGIFEIGFLQKFLKSSHPFSLNIAKLLSQKTAELIEDLTDLSLSSTKERLAKFLIREHEIQKRPSSFKLPLNQSQLASHLGTVREIVSRDLASLRKSKVIDSKQGEISVLDEAELKKIAEGFSFHPEPVSGQ